MFHPYRKDSSYLCAAIFISYKEKCAYCGRTIQQRDMHIDHIIPSNQQEIIDDEVREYLIELDENGFVVDSIENYLPFCPACNINKSNRVFTAANLRFFHEKARTHVEEIKNISMNLQAQALEYSNQYQKMRNDEAFGLQSSPMVLQNLDALKNLINIKTAKLHEYTTGKSLELEKIIQVFYEYVRDKQSWKNIKTNLLMQNEEIVK